MFRQFCSGVLPAMPTRWADRFTCECTCPEPSARCASLLPNLDTNPKQEKRPTRWADRFHCECTCPDLNWGPPPCQGGALTGLRYRCVVLLFLRPRGVDARWRRDLNPCRRLCRPLPRLSATPPWNQTVLPSTGRNPPAFRADDGIRTRDPHLGKVMRYQLRYVRNAPDAGSLCQVRAHFI